MAGTAVSGRYNCMDLKTIVVKRILMLLCIKGMAFSTSNHNFTQACRRLLNGYTALESIRLHGRLWCDTRHSTLFPPGYYAGMDGTVTLKAGLGVFAYPSLGAISDLKREEQHENKEGNHFHLSTPFSELCGLEAGSIP